MGVVFLASLSDKNQLKWEIPQNGFTIGSLGWQFTRYHLSNVQKPLMTLHSTDWFIRILNNPPIHLSSIIPYAVCIANNQGELVTVHVKTGHH